MPDDLFSPSKYTDLAQYISRTDKARADYFALLLRDAPIYERAQARTKWMMMEVQLQKNTNRPEVVKNRDSVREEAAAKGVSILPTAPIVWGTGESTGYSPMPLTFSYPPRSVPEAWERAIIEEVNIKLRFEQVSMPNGQRYAAGFKEFSDMLNHMKQNPQVMIGGLPYRDKPWWHNNYKMWTEHYSPTAPLLLDRLATYPPMWYLAQRVNEDFLNKPPLDHLKDFFQDRTDMYFAVRATFEPRMSPEPVDFEYEEMVKAYFGGPGKEETSKMPWWLHVIDFVIRLHPVTFALLTGWDMITGYNIFGYKLSTFERVALPLTFILRGPLKFLFRIVGEMSFVVRWTEALAGRGRALAEIGQRAYFWLTYRAGYLTGIARNMIRQMIGRLKVLGQFATSMMKDALEKTLKYIEVELGAAIQSITEVLADWIEKAGFSTTQEAFAVLSDMQIAIDTGKPDAPVLMQKIVKPFTDQLSTLADRIAAKIANPAKAQMASKVEQYVLTEIPLTLEEFTKKLIKEHPGLSGFDEQCVTRIMGKYFDEAQIQAQVVEELLPTEVWPKIEQNLANIVYAIEDEAGKRFLKARFLEGHSLASLKNQPLTDGMIAYVDDTVTEELQKEGAVGVIYALNIFEAKLSAKMFRLLEFTMDKLQSGGRLAKELVPYLQGVAEWAYDKAVARALRNGQQPPIWNAFRDGFVKENEAQGGQIARDTLRFLKDKYIMYRGQKYKLVVGPGGRASEVTFTAVIPSNVVSATTQANTLAKLAARSFENVSIEVVSVTEEQLGQISGKITTQVCDWVKQGLLKEELLQKQWLAKMKATGKI